MIAFDRQAFTKAQPSKIADLLDIQRFPGKRALPNGPRYTLELALLADGVEPASIYSELATPAGADRAFAALDKIKPQILWWSKAEDAIGMLMQRKASMAAGFSGRIFRAAVSARQRIDVLWDGQIYDLDLWAIPKGAANKEDAKRFIAFATEPAQMAAQAELIAYGPMRKSAIALVGKHPSIDIEMKGFLPTAPDNFKKALKFDEVWWKDHGAELETRFKTWREQPAVIDAKARRRTESPKPAGRQGPRPRDRKVQARRRQGCDRRRKNPSRDEARGREARGREAGDAGGANRFSAERRAKARAETYAQQAAVKIVPWLRGLRCHPTATNAPRWRCHASNGTPFALDHARGSRATPLTRRCGRLMHLTR